MENLESLLARLIQHHVEFVVVGGYAAAAHGVTLVTQDIDVCCRFSRENLIRLEAALADLHPTHRMTMPRRPFNLTRDWRPELDNLDLQTDWGQLDCLNSVLAVGDFDAVREQSVKIEFSSGRCLVLGIDALIKAKKAMGRLHDKLAAIQLIAIRERNSQKRPSNRSGCKSRP